MPHVLSKDQLDECFTQLRNMFVDFQFFDALVANNLQQLLVDSNKIDINIASIRTVTLR